MSRIQVFTDRPLTSARPNRLVVLLFPIALLGSSTSCDVPPQALQDLLGVDVSVSQSVTNASPAEGALTSFVVRVRNNGPVEVTNVVGTDSLSSGLAYDSHTISTGAWFDPVLKQWTVERLGVAQEAVFTLVARTNPGTAGTTQSNVVSINVTSDLVADSTSSNNRRATTVTVATNIPPVSPQGFTNEPPGFRALSTWDWTSHEGGGWRWEGANPVTGAFQSVVSAGYGSAPPVGGPGVLQATYVAGSIAGSGAGRTYFPITADEVFIGYWTKFEADYRSSDNPGGNKMFFLITGPSRAFLAYRDLAQDVPRRNYNLYMSTYGPNPNNELWAEPAFPIPYDEWYKVEMHYKRSTAGSQNGILKVWFNGVKAFEYTNLVNPYAVTNMYFEGTHNGEYIGGVRRIPTAMHWFVGRTYVSVPN